jgi:hypothetical protein
MMGNADRLFGWEQVALVVGTFAALLLIAKLYARPELVAQATRRDARLHGRRVRDRITRAA